MREQLPLIFHGSSYDPAKDRKRLAKQFGVVKAYMLDGKKHTLRQISEATNAPEASVSRRLRELRNHGYNLKKERVPNQPGVWEYWIEGGKDE